MHKVLEVEEIGAAITLARNSLSDFIPLMSPWWRPTWFHTKICEALERVERGECKRLLVQMAPRAGKSAIISVHFPAWFLGRNPDKRIIHAAYGADLSNMFSRDVRNMVRDDERYKALFPKVSVSMDAQSVTQWELCKPWRGGFRSVGIGGGVTGHGADLILCDDPLKGAEASESELQRESLWHWWQAEMLTRLAPGGCIALVGTPWFEDDIYHRAIQTGEWEVIRIPARNEQGQVYWPERFDDAAMITTEMEVGTRTWNSLYMLSPTGSDGLEFKKDWFNEVWNTLPPLDEAWTRYDTALKEGEKNDRTAYLTVARGKDGLLYGIDGDAGHWSGDQISAEIEKNYIANMRRFGGLYRGEFVEDAAAGALMIQRWRGSHVNVIPVKVPRVGKLIRARGVAALVESRRFRPPANKSWWTDIFLPEITAFPLGAHDDCLDVFVGALERYGSFTDAVTERNVYGGDGVRWRRPG